MNSESWQMTEKMYAIEACRKAQQEEEAEIKEDKVVSYFIDEAVGLTYDEYFRTEAMEEKQARLRCLLLGIDFVISATHIHSQIWYWIHYNDK